MKAKTTAAVLSLLFLAPVAMADHDYRRGFHASASQWAHYYAETALRQVHQNRRQHCNYYGQRWSGSYHDHYHWALRVSRGHAQSEINRRDRDLAHCRVRHGGYYNYYGHDYYGHGRHHSKRGHARPHHGHRHRQYDNAYDWRGHGSRSHGNRRDGRDDHQGRHDDRRGRDDGRDRRRGG